MSTVEFSGVTCTIVPLCPATNNVCENKEYKGA